MAAGIIIHISADGEKRTEYFSAERVRIGSDETCDIQIRGNILPVEGPWIDLENADGVFRVINFADGIDLSINGKPLRRFIGIMDGDTIAAADADLSFSFFSLEARSALITTNREQPHISRFIEAAALEAAASPKRDDAKAFLREFTRELLSEISWTTKAISIVLATAFILGILYIGYSVNRQLTDAREQNERQLAVITKLEDRLAETKDQLGELDRTNKDLINTVSLAQNMRVEYGNSVCLIFGVYDLVDRKSGKVFRYIDPQTRPYQVEPTAPEEPGSPPPAFGVTTDGNGPTVEYDFIGTGFYVGGGYLVTNRHVVRPWEEDDQVKQIIAGGGSPRVKRLIVYFPSSPQPFELKMRGVGAREDIAVGYINPEQIPADIKPVPLDLVGDAAAVGKTVVTIGYPSGPDRLLAMVDDDEAKAINRRFGNSRKNLIEFLAQSRKIVPLTTQGAITDLDARRIVHDAKTAEGGSGAPLFGPGGKVIGINFGVFTENTAANMAVPVKFAVDLLRTAGWSSPEEPAKKPDEQGQVSTTDPAAASASTVKRPQ
ncbi:MAG: trypsin-like peptidase domain-containing protein [Acidobacteria bacterium]|nr:trypsin-like peptidase domain-containing protein [Acidobacteriota bacterium]MCW5948750.1 trypsin-like peptidase domain-containing protein [Pyrinomonadaceae bacterium]